MPLWAYHWSDEDTYYTPIEAPNVQEAIKKIEKAWSRLLNGHIWLVDEKTKFKPPANDWIIVCFAVLHREDESFARFHPTFYTKTLYWDEKSVSIGEAR